MSEAQTLTGEGWQLRYQTGRGLELRVLGAVVSRGSSAQIAAPDWRQGFYSSNDKSVKVESIENGIRLTHPLPAEQGMLVETIRKRDDRALEWHIEARWEGEEPAILEWSLSYVNLFSVMGASLHGEGDLAMNALTPETRELENGVLFRGSALRAQGRLGQLEWIWKSDGSFVALDGRALKDRWWASTPSLWIGVTDRRLTRSQTLTLKAELQIIPKTLPTPASPVTAQTSLQTRNDWRLPESKPPVLIPKPQVVRWQTGHFQLTPQTPLLYESAIYRPAAAALQRMVQQRYGWNLLLKEDAQPREGAIFFGGSPERQRTLPVPDQPEAYCLQVTSDKIQVVGRRPVGAFYGAQTLLQLLQPEEGLRARAVIITDYPHMAFRGVHFFGGNQTDFQERLIRDALPHFKLNHLVFECSYTQWETNPQMWVDFSMPKPVLKNLVQAARDNFLEPIPLIEAFGHGHWMFRNGANLNLAEDPETPWAYCPRKRASYDFIFGVFDEAIEIFQPKYFHIGHDEVTMRGRMPHCSQCQGTPFAQLFVEETRRLHTFLRSRQMDRVMMWSDMLLAKGEANDGGATAKNPEEAAFKRNALPKSLIQFDWHYTPAAPEGYISLNTLKNAGFDRIVATTWFNPENIYSFAQAARTQRIWGLLQSTWAGYNVTEQTLNSGLHQFAAYVLAAEYAWNSGSPPPQDLPYDYEEAFVNAYQPELIPLQAQAGFTVDLRKAYNTALSDTDGSQWSGSGANSDLQAFPTGDARLRGVRFQLAESNAQPSALMLVSPLAPKENLPNTIKIPLDRKSSELCLLHCTGWGANQNAEIARMTVRYADGSEEALTMLYGVHLRAWDDPGMAFRAPVAWSGQTQAGKPVRVRMMSWKNPHPNKAIREIEIKAMDPAAGYTLIGLSGQ